MQGVYIGQAGEEIWVEIVVFDDAATAENNVTIYTENEYWNMIVLDNTVIYAVNGLDGEDAVELLMTSPALDRETIEDNIVNSENGNEEKRVVPVE